MLIDVGEERWLLEEECGVPCCSISGVLDRKELQEKAGIGGVGVCVEKLSTRLCMRAFLFPFLVIGCIVTLFGLSFSFTAALVWLIGLSRKPIRGVVLPKLGVFSSGYIYVTAFSG